MNIIIASQYGVTGATLEYVVRAEIAVKPDEEDPPENYETVDQEMTATAPHTGRPFVNDRRNVWYIMSKPYVGPTNWISDPTCQIQVGERTTKSV
jgi:hypothetical protein